MASNSFKIKNSLVLTPKDLATLVSPEAGDLACDINDSNKIKRYDANSSSWVEVGSGGGVGGTDIFFVQDFESASLASFTQTGLTLSQTDPLHGKVSALLTHQAAVNQSFKQVIAVDRKFRGETMTLRLNCKSNAPAGDVTINIYDETNAANLVASEQLQLSNDASGALSRVGFTIPETCASISYTITALPEAGSPVTRIDDIIAELAVTSLLETSVEVPVVTAWNGYTPTFQGFGTPTNIEFEWRQVGENVEIRGKFVTGITTTVEARIGLPAGLTSAGTSLIPSLQTVGLMARDVNTSSPFSILVEPSVSYVNLGLYVGNSPLQKRLATELFSTSGIAASFFASVPCAGLSATSTKTVALTQSGLVQSADSYIRLNTGNGFGSTSTSIRRFATIQKNIGSTIRYIDSSSTGASFTALIDGLYHVSYTEQSTSGTPSMNIYVNGITVSTATISTATGNASCSTPVYLVAGDIVTVGSANFTILASAGGNVYFEMSYQGSLKQVSVNPNSKITIPTSELRFEGASTRGSTATAIVKFDTLAKIRGDAFTVTNTAADGTFVTMLKAGQLSVSASVIVGAANSQMIISKNQTNLTSAGAFPGETIAATNQPTISNFATASGSQFVNVGDVIRVALSGANPSSNIASNFLLSFQEQDIAVSVTNTLPQFSESDSSVRVDTANGYGSTATQIRRFSNVRQNLGTDITYTDSATAGASFQVMESGTYSISYTDEFTTASWLGISKNASSLTTSIFSLDISEKLASSYTGATNASGFCGWTGYLVKGDVIRAHTAAATTGTNAEATFTISKVGKPNVTGVNVTPFINVPQPDTEVINAFGNNGFGSTNTGVARWTTLRQNTNKGIISYSDSATLGGSFTALKSAVITITATGQANATSAAQYYVTKNATTLTLADLGFANEVMAAGTAPISQFESISATFNVVAGDVVRFQRQGTANATGSGSVTVTATALSDQILTAPEAFSTDTASLTYASSAAYTLATLSSAPIGSYITFTYAINTNTRTQTSTRPTQTDADMNANGMLIYTRAYNAASTAAQPAAFAIQIGKGLKGRTLDLYKSAGKVTSGEIDGVLSNSFTIQNGLQAKSYDEKTGILYVDSGRCMDAAVTTYQHFFSDLTSQTSGYLVINASKNPALTGFGLNRIAARAVQTSGQVFGNTATTVLWNSAKTFDTHGIINTGTGVATIPETGYYQVNATVHIDANAFLAANQRAFLAIVKNGVTYSLGEYRVQATANLNSFIVTVNDVVFLGKGDTVSISLTHNITASRALLASAGYNYFAITKTSV